MAEQPRKIKRLFFDIETSYNVVASWNIGYDLNIGHDCILKERAIICICYKWEGERKVQSLHWNKGDDKQMLKSFLEIMNSADEVVGHNCDRFDEKWIRTRALIHGLNMFPKYYSIDTLKLAKNGFKFNSNRLDYIGSFLGIGGKMDTGGFKLWKAIVENNDKSALEKMIKYCKRDVKILEEVYHKLNPYVKEGKVHAGVVEGRDRCSCSQCGSENTIVNRHTTKASGLKVVQMKCKDCGKHTHIPESIYLKLRDKK